MLRNAIIRKNSYITRFPHRCEGRVYLLQLLREEGFSNLLESLFPKEKYFPHLREQKIETIKLHLDAHTNTSIAKKFGVSVTTISRTLIKADIDLMFLCLNEENQRKVKLFWKNKEVVKKYKFKSVYIRDLFIKEFDISDTE